MVKKELSDVATLDEQDTEYIQKDANFFSRILDKAKNALCPTGHVDPSQANKQISDEQASRQASEQYREALRRQGGKLLDETNPEWTADELAKLSGLLLTRSALNVVGMPVVRPENLKEFAARTGIMRSQISTLTHEELRARVQPVREHLPNDVLLTNLAGILGVGESVPQFLQRTGLSTGWLMQATREQILSAVLSGLKHGVETR